MKLHLMVTAATALALGCGGGSGTPSSSRVLISGGRDTATLASAELYDSVRGLFVATGAMNGARESHTSTRLNNGQILAAGGGVEQVAPNGEISVSPVASAELYHPSRGRFTSTGSLRTARFFHTATLLNNGRVLVAGGDDGNGRTLSSSELYDPAAGMFAPAGQMNDPREQHTATALKDGRLLFAGGTSCTNSASCAIQSSAEIYDPASGTFTLTGPMNQARQGHTATLLADGRVLIAGGAGPGGAALANAELYDPVRDEFTPTRNMTDSRLGHVAVALANGTVLLAGGFDARGNIVKTSEIYDPSTGSFTPSGSMAVGRLNPTTITLNSGQVLVAGGWIQCPSPFYAVCLAPTDSAELYDPVSGTFSSTGKMNRKRAGQAASRF